jgi:hypothetical protein
MGETWVTGETRVPQDQVKRLDLSIGFTACRLEKGDCLRLHICSAAHPRWLRHPLQPQGEDWLLGDSEAGIAGVDGCRVIQGHPGSPELQGWGVDDKLTKIDEMLKCGEIW